MNFDREFLFVCPPLKVIINFCLEMRKPTKLIELMGTGNFFTIKSHCDFVNKGLVYEFGYGNMRKAVSSFLVFVCSYMFYVFGSIFRHIFSFVVGKNPEKNESVSSVVYPQQDDHQIGSSCCQYSEIDKSIGERENSIVLETASAASASKYEFLSGRDFSGFVEEPMNFSFTIHEFFADSNNKTIINTQILESAGSTDEDFQELDSEAQVYVEERAENTGDFVKSSVIKNVSEKQEQETFSEEKIFEVENKVLDYGVSTEKDFGKHDMDVEDCVAEKAGDSVKSLAIEKDIGKHEVQTFLEENVSEKEEMIEFGGSCDSSNEFESSCDAKEESVCSNGDDEIDSITDELLPNRIVGEGFSSEIPKFIDEEKVEYNGEPNAVLLRDEFTDSDDDYIELEPQRQSSSVSDEEILCGEDLCKLDNKHDHQDSIPEDAQPKAEVLGISEAPRLQEKCPILYCDAQDDTDFRLEHQDLIQQLKLELKHVRTGGLPTILEESEAEELESPMIVQELKPLKIDKKFEHRDHMDEIQKVYRHYLDKMRKLDVLNFQTMHALGLLQLKDKVQLHKAPKLSVPAIKLRLFQNLWSCKQGIAAVDPTKKVIASMQSEFEMVYVGQLCLSWEMLHWQLRKIQEMQKYDCQGLHQYNQVVGEFQLFQVLVQRFMENEQLQGPRVQNYVKNRCILRSLLQVPLVKDDSLKEKGRRGDDEDAVTIQMLIESIEESMRLFWLFLRADKDESNKMLQDDTLEDLVDLELFIDIQTDVQKKERKLKDILRSGNCIVKRFQKHHEDQMHHALFLAQVELKLISRVLNMSKLTADQLLWCQGKLKKINFRNRKIFVEPSFVFFPC